MRRMGAGPRVVLVHGFTQTGATLGPLAERLAGSREVVLPDLPGHGGSPAASGDLYTAAAQLGDSCGQATYAGYSLGGRLCLHLALARPGVVERLVLMSATAGIEDAEERARRAADDERLAERIEAGGEEGLPSFLDEWLQGPLFSTLEAGEAGRESRLANTASGLAGSLRHHGTGRQLPLWERLGELTMPVLVLVGERDPKFLAQGERLAQAVGPNASLVVVPGAGHSLPLEEPAAVAGVIARLPG